MFYAVGDGDGKLEIIRGVGTQCGGSSSPRPTFSIYDETYSKVFTSPELSQNIDSRVYLITGELLPRGGEEIAVGTWSNVQSYPGNIKIFQYNGSTYEEVWSEELGASDEDVYHLKISDLDKDGKNELFVSTTYGLRVYATAVDTDGDGYTSDVDCNDNDPAINPDATEICDGKDNNCDGAIDEGFSLNDYYYDADADGYGNPAVSIQACAQPLGYVTNNLDCNDINSAINPSATEIR